MRILLYCLFILSFSTISGFAEDLKKFAGKSKGELHRGNVRLFWSLKKWPQSLKGFQIYRKEVSSESPYRKLNSRIVRPEMTLELAEKIGDPELFRAISVGEKNEKPFEVMVANMNSAGADLELLCRRLWHHYDMARPYGLAYQDTTAKLGKTYSYRVVPVVTTPVEGLPADRALFDIKVSTSINILSCPVSALKVTRLDSSTVKIEWTASAKDYHSKKINGFRLFRGSDAKPVELLSDFLIGPHPAAKTEKVLKFTAFDRKSSAEGCCYAVEPNHEGYSIRELSKSSRLEQLLTDYPLPVIGKPESTHEKIRLSWSFPEHITDCKCFRIQRYTEGETAAKTIAELDDVTTRSYVDRKLPAPGHMVRYRVTVISSDYRNDKTSKDSETVRIPFIPMPRTDSFTVSKELKENKMVAVFKWKQILHDNIDGYQLQKMSLSSSRWWNQGEKTTKTEAEVDLSGLQRGKEYFFRVLGMTKEGQMSPPSKLLKVTVTYAKPLTPVISYSNGSNGILSLKWQLPFSKEVKGFRLYLDGKLHTDEKTISGNSRQQLFKGLKLNQQYRVSLSAVSTSGAESRKSPAKICTIKSRTLPVNSMPKSPEVDYDTAIVKKEQQMSSNDSTQAELIYHYVVAKDGRRVLHGDKVLYGPTAKPSSRLIYARGRMHGLQRWYDSDGKLIFAAFYEKGKPVTKEIYFQEYGKVSLSAEELKFLKKSKGSK